MLVAESVRSLRFSSQDGQSIDCSVKFDHLGSEVPFTASKNDPENHGRSMYDDLVAGKYGEIAPYTGPAPITGNTLILSQIAALELLQTPRRIREATINTAGRAWLEALEAQIDTLRGQLIP